MRYPHLVPFLASLGLGLVTNAWGCSCPAPDLEKIWVDAEHIFVAEIEKVSLVTDAGTSADMLASFRVIETLKGKPESVSYLLGSTNAGFSCDFDFRTGERYLVVTDDAGNVSTCGGSINLDVGKREPLMKEFQTLYADMTLEYFRAKVFDASSDCTYSRSAQIEELIRIRDMRRTDWEWRPAYAVPAKGEVHFEDNYGQKLVASLGGCHDLGYQLKLLGVRVDLTDEEVLGIAFEMAASFWVADGWNGMIEAVRLRDTGDIRGIVNGKPFTDENDAYTYEIRYDRSSAMLSVSQFSRMSAGSVRP